MLAEVRWRPDPIFMLDVCDADGHLWLVEINGFSFSWLYQCDVAAAWAWIVLLGDKTHAWGNPREAVFPRGPDQDQGGQ
jgi:hypothetical protein